jgi:LEA14-like dessication related protein
MKYNKPVKMALAALLLMAAFTTCQTLGAVFSEPRLSLQSVEMTGISFTGVDLLCKVNVENPNPIDIPFPEIDWELFVNANSFIKGVVKNNNAIKSRAQTVVDVPVRATYQELADTVKSLGNSREADYRIALGAKFALPVLGNKVWRFEHAGVLPVLKVPSISFKGIRVKNISLSRLDFDLDWEVENKNGFAMNVKDLSYDLAVNRSQWASARVSDARRLPPDAKTTIPLSFSINGLAMVREITDIITRGSDVSYACGGNIKLGGDLRGLGDLDIPLNFAGTTRLGK